MRNVSRKRRPHSAPQLPNKRQPSGLGEGAANSHTNRDRRRGNAMVEFSLVFILFSGMTLGFCQLAFWIWARTALHYSVQQAARFSVTGRVRNGLGHVDSIKSVVRENAGGLLSYPNAADDIHVEFYDESGNLTTRNDGGNTVVVSVRDFELPIISVIPDFGLPKDPLDIEVSAVQKLEPYATPPAL